MALADPLNIEVIYCPEPGQVDLRQVQLSPGAVLADAVQASGILAAHPEPASGWRLGIWGRVQDPKTPLRNFDRVELYRGLLIDPKESRRLRYKRHRSPKPPRAA